MLFQKHGCQYNQHCENQSAASDRSVFFQPFALEYGRTCRHRIKNMDAGQYISRRIYPVKMLHHIHKEIIPGEYYRPEILGIGVDIRDYQKQCHADSKGCDEPVIIGFILVDKGKIKYGCRYEGKP